MFYVNILELYFHFTLIILNTRYKAMIHMQCYGTPLPQHYTIFGCNRCSFYTIMPYSFMLCTLIHVLGVYSVSLYSVYWSLCLVNSPFRYEYISLCDLYRSLCLVPSPSVMCMLNYIICTYLNVMCTRRRDMCNIRSDMYIHNYSMRTVTMSCVISISLCS